MARSKKARARADERIAEYKRFWENFLHAGTDWTARFKMELDMIIYEVRTGRSKPLPPTPGGRYPGDPWRKKMREWKRRGRGKS